MRMCVPLAKADGMVVSGLRLTYYRDKILLSKKPVKG